MSNQTKIIIALTFIMMVMVYRIGQSQAEANLVNTSVQAAGQPQTTVQTSQDENVELVSDSTIRIRIIPNSNKYEDQQAKKLVRYAVDEFLTENQPYLTDIESTREFIAMNIETIEKKVAYVLNSIDYKEGYKITYGAHLFPEKELNGVYYEEGYYESLVITLGDGTGSNWWCFMNADLCLGPSLTKSNTDHWNAQYSAMESTQEAFQNKEFKSFFGEVLSKVFRSEQDNELENTYASSVKTDKSTWYLYEDEY